MKIKLSHGATAPVRKHSDDAGADICAVGDVDDTTGETVYLEKENHIAIIQPKTRMSIKTGVSFEIDTDDVPIGTTREIQIRARSGLARKNGIMLVNSPATIDAGYRGEVDVILYNSSDEPFSFSRGDRVAQIVIGLVFLDTFEVVEKFSDETDRGEGGFGSTGIS